MSKVLIIGAGGVGTVVAHKVAKVPQVFTDILLASRRKSKCDGIAKAVGANRIETAQVDANNVRQLIDLGALPPLSGGDTREHASMSNRYPG